MDDPDSGRRLKTDVMTSARAHASIAPASGAAPERRRLRRELRARRQALTDGQQHDAAMGLLAVLRARPEVRRARRVAVYLPQDGEIDPRPIADWLYARRVLVCLPVIDPIARGSQRLRFAPWHPDTRFAANRFGIPEPVAVRSVPGWTLDLVLLPLVGFDAVGHRLGMGGGFYDRSFDLRRPRANRPRLIGIAHDLQQVDALPAAAHDVPLHGIATERRFIDTTATPRGRG